MKYLKLAIAAYSVILGVSIIGLWILLLLNGDIPEGSTEMGFHLFAEFFMAVICILGGFMIIYKKKHAREISIAGLAMVIYSVVNAAGYYGQRDEISLVILFILIGLLSLAAIAGQLFFRR